MLLTQRQRQCPEIVACGCGLFRIHAAHCTHDGRHLRLIRVPRANSPVELPPDQYASHYRTALLCSLDPVLRSAGTIRSIGPLQHDALKPKAAGRLKQVRANLALLERGDENPVRLTLEQSAKDAAYAATAAVSL